MEAKTQFSESVKSFTKTTELEFTPRLDQKVIDVLNLQIKNELYSANLYKAISSWCSNGPWSNAFKVFFKYGQEEMTHMDKIIEYLDDKNCKFIIPECPKPPCEFKDMREIVTKALQHEINVTKNWEDISNTALACKDNTTHEFATWYLREQREEESKQRELLYKIDLGMPDWMLDLEFKELLG